MRRWRRASPDRVDLVSKCKCRERGRLFLQRKYAYRLETNKPAPLRGTFADRTRRCRRPRRSRKKYSRSRHDLLWLLRGFSLLVIHIVKKVQKVGGSAFPRTGRAGSIRVECRRNTTQRCCDN